jgi:hypothetical protein
MYVPGGAVWVHRLSLYFSDDHALSVTQAKLPSTVAASGSDACTNQTREFLKSSIGCGHRRESFAEHEPHADGIREGNPGGARRHGEGRGGAAEGFANRSLINRDSEPEWTR